MEIEKIYGKVANAVNELATKLDASASFMPIGVDGAVTYHLLEHAFIKEIPHEDNLKNNIVQVSSKTEKTDEARLFSILRKNAFQKKSLYGLDMRTKTGKLGALLKSSVISLNEKLKLNYLEGLEFSYVVLFDSGRHADIRASEKELTDEEKRCLRWFEKPEDSFIKFENGVWEYYATHDRLAKLRHVQKIKNLI
ncbi:MAG: hypothetical protein GTN36_05235 [Candidatus Aenigmarchaeota archaeon]|nr:hypothetical protein [Candidatus Aenigmarchaeota archaeon]